MGIIMPALHRKFTPEWVAIAHRRRPLKTCLTGRMNGEGLRGQPCWLPAHEWLRANPSVPGENKANRATLSSNKREPG